MAKRRLLVSIFRIIAGTALTLIAAACSSPQKTQDFFAKAVREDPRVVLLHKTPLYSVYYDHVLRRCVLHSAYTDETAGSSAGAGLGVSVFTCEPERIKTRALEVNSRIENGTGALPLPAVAPPAQRPVSPPNPANEGAAP